MPLDVVDGFGEQDPVLLRVAGVTRLQEMLLQKFPLGLLPSSRHWVGVTLTALPPAKHFSLPLLDYYYYYYK